MAETVADSVDVSVAREEAVRSYAAAPAPASREAARGAPWPGAYGPGEGLPDPSRDRPPTVVFALGLVVWGVGLALLIGNCASPG